MKIETVDQDVQNLAADLRLAVMRLARRLRQRADTGATPSMLSALSSIERLGPLTIGEVAAVERVAPPTMTAIVSRLEAAGLVAREADPEDRRVSRVNLSRAGRALMERSRSLKTAYLARKLRTMDERDRAALRRGVGIIERLLEDER
jgi:DNA-binding MarR family transcriptional regulator